MPLHSETHTRLRRAVSAGEFVKASAIWETYATQVIDAIRGGNFSSAELAQIRELIDWTRGVATCARGQGQRRINTVLAGLHVAKVYRQPPG